MLTNVSGPLTDNAPYKPKPGILGGGSIEWLPGYAPGKWNSGVRLELLYAQKGWKDQVQHTDEEGHLLGWSTVGTMHVDELVLSALYTLRIPAEKVTPILPFGPEAGFNLRADEVISSALGGGTWKNPWHWKHQPNLGLNTGAGITFPVGAGELSCDARYNLGLTNMTQSHYSLVSPIKTSGIQLVFGYSFRVWIQFSSIVNGAGMGMAICAIKKIK